MIKLMNSLLLLLIFCGGFYSIQGEKLECLFTDNSYLVVGILYSCYVTTLDNSFNNITIDGYTGAHLENKNDKEVDAIYILSTNIKYIPKGLGSLFNLTALTIQTSLLVEIKADNFLGMQNLEYLNLWNNKLTFVPSDAFSKLIKLKAIYLGLNHIQFIGSGVFDELLNLKFVFLRSNICIDKNYEGRSIVIHLKNDIKANCMDETITKLEIELNTIKINHFEEMKNVNNKKSKLKNKFIAAQNEHQMNKFKHASKNRELLEKISFCELNQRNHQKEKDALMQDKDALKKNYDALMQDKDALIKDKDALMQDKDALKKNYDELMQDKDAVIEEHAAEQSKNDQLKSELSALKVDLQNKVNDLEKVNNESRHDLVAAQNEHQINKLVYEYMTQELVENLSNCELNQQKSMIMMTKDLLELNNKTTELTFKCNYFTMNCIYLNTNRAYTCETRDLTINHKDMKLNEVIGVHLKSKSNQEVTELVIVKSSMFYWSKDIFTKFPALQTLRIQNAQLNEFKKGDFNSAFKLTVIEVNGNNIALFGDDVFHETEEHLTEINMNSNQIEKISAGTFRGLKQLKVLSLKDNLITEIPFGSFKDIVMLEILILTGNKIQFLDGKMLQFNKRLMTLAVDQNELREVGEEILNHSKMLKDVNLEGNDCIDELTGTDDDSDDGRTINDLIFVIRNCCKNSAEGLNAYYCG